MIYKTNKKHISLLLVFLMLFSTVMSSVSFAENSSKDSYYIVVEKEGKYHRFTKEQYQRDVIKKDESGNIVHGPLYEYLKKRNTVSVTHYILNIGDDLDPTNDRYLTREEYSELNIIHGDHYETLKSEKAKYYNEMYDDFIKNLYNVDYKFGENGIEVNLINVFN